MLIIDGNTNIGSIFHDIDVVSKKTGMVMRLTGIGKTRADAEATIRNYNLKCDDFDERYELRNPDEKFLESSGL